MSDHCKPPPEKLVTLRPRRPADAAPEVGGPEPDEGDPNRRDFLTVMGFGVGAASLAACRAPEQRAIPLPVAAEDMIAGLPNFYATTCGGCASACSLVVKQRDGRPIKIEGNEASALFGGATCATGQATVLSLYDDERLRGPLWQGKPAAWAEVDEQIETQLRAASGKPGKIALVTTTITSPTLRGVIARWEKAFPGLRHVSYDAISISALRSAANQMFGRPLVPHYRFDRARVVVGLDADFLGTWLSPVEFARAYSEARKPARAPRGAAPLHVQFEPGMSVTGSNADQRVAVAPSELGAIASGLLARIAKRAGEPATQVAPDPIDGAILDRVADQLWQQRGASLVVSGANDSAIQLAVLTLNRLLGNLGHTVDVERPSLQRQGDDAAMATLIDDMQRGELAAVILHGVNPAYDHADSAGFARGLAKVALSVSTTDRRDETAALVTAVCPDHHFLESWGDAEPVVGYLSLTQPTIAPLYDTRAFAESLLRWIGEPTDAYSLLRDHWKTHIMPRAAGATSFDPFWDQTLERGVLDLGAAEQPAPAPTDAGGNDWHAAVAEIRDERQRAPAGDHLELALYESVALRDGRHANNPWLLELADPVHKLTWGNAAAIAPATADQLGLRDGDVVALAAGGATVELPVLRQPGQHPRTISVALGFGRQLVGRAGNGVGVNAFPLTRAVRGARRTWADGATLTRTGRRDELARTQSHFSMEDRPIALEMTAEDLAHAGEAEELPNLWNERAKGDRLWGMAIDLDACTGCSACVIACQSENNVPVVGKDQIQRQRSMAWIRIDRYYKGGDASPEAVHQPMMCQHCNHAPCETVCPVLATTTSSEGLNQQVYNRCIGTRYCANNCPYKVRRFNWYNYTTGNHSDYNMASSVGRLVLNPDVTVRTRGVMEKCSLCVQRIHVAKNDSVKRGTPIVDGEIKTACQQVCPADAIRFGDLNDPKSAVAQQMAGPRTYRVLEDLGTRPNVAYLKKVRHGQTT